VEPHGRSSSARGSEPALRRQLALRRAAGDGLRSVGVRLIRVGDTFYEPPTQRAFRHWDGRRGDQTLRLDYPLGPDSMVVDVGGYQGQWASDIYARFRCRVLVFEPVPEFARLLAERFVFNDDVEVLQLGLAGRSRREDMLLSGDASSACRSGGRRLSADIVEAGAYFEHRRISGIDLMKVNIEGGEYELLEHLLDTGWVGRIDHLQIQFHDFAQNAEARMASIRRLLAESHRCAWSHAPFWESWSRDSNRNCPSGVSSSEPEA